MSEALGTPQVHHLWLSLHLSLQLSQHLPLSNWQQLTETRFSRLVHGCQAGGTGALAAAPPKPPWSHFHGTGIHTFFFFFFFNHRKFLAFSKKKKKKIL